MMGLWIFTGALGVGTLMAIACARGSKLGAVGTALSIVLVDGAIVLGGYAALWAAGLAQR